MAETCDIHVEGSYLRMEYIQDTDGAWLEPHRDIPEKLFSMVIYLFTGPDAAEWGTDIYDADKRWVGRSAGEFNSGVIFVAGSGDLARLRSASDHWRAPADGDQLRPAELARPRAARVSGSADQAALASVVSPLCFGRIATAIMIL